MVVCMQFFYIASSVADTQVKFSGENVPQKPTYCTWCKEKLDGWTEYLEYEDMQYSCVIEQHYLSVLPQQLTLTLP